MKIDHLIYKILEYSYTTYNNYIIFSGTSLISQDRFMNNFLFKTSRKSQTLHQNANQILSPAASATEKVTINDSHKPICST